MIYRWSPIACALWCPAVFTEHGLGEPSGWFSAVLRSFSLLYGIPLYEYIPNYWSILLLMDIWVVLSSGLFQTFTSRSLSAYEHVFLWVYIWEGFCWILGVDVCLTVKDTAQWFSKVVVPP